MTTRLVLGCNQCESFYMPTPRSNETREDFIDRCIPIVIDDGTAEDGSQAFAICSSMFDNKEVKMTEVIVTTEEVVAEEEKSVKPNNGKAVVASYIPHTATSFDDVEEFMKAEETRSRVDEVTRQFETLSSNIMYNEEVTDKVGALKTLVDQLDGRLNEAIDLGSKSLWDVVKSVFTKPEPKPEPKTKNGLFVWKEGDRFRWFAVYSNKYRDDDNPPEILSEKAHLAFVEMVDKGDVPYPELWHWHIPGTRWGQADWIAYDTDLGFSLASGFVDRGHEEEAKSIVELTEPLAVSHGLIALERNKKDETIIDKYVSTEISDLPVEAAANKLTGFSMIEAKEYKMIPDEKKHHLRSVGLTDVQISEIENDLAAKASKAEEAGLQFKEAVAVETPVEGDIVKIVPDVVLDTEGDEATADLTVEPVTREEVAEAIVATEKRLQAEVKAIAEILAGLTKSDDEKIKQVAEDTPAFSIAHLVHRDMSVIGKSITETDEKDGPRENDHQSDEKSISGVPWIDDILVGEKS